MLEKWDDGKIAIEGSVELKTLIKCPIVTWFEKTGEADRDKFDFIVDAGMDNGIIINDKGSDGAWNKMGTTTVHCGKDDKVSLLQSLIRYLYEPSVYDVDFADAKTSWGSECYFKSTVVGLDEAKKDSADWIKNIFSFDFDDAFIHVHSNASLMDIGDTVEKMDKVITAEKGQKNLLVAVSYDSDECEDDSLKIGVWCR